MTNSTNSSGTRTGILAGNLLMVVGTLLLAASLWVKPLAPYRPTLTIVGIVLFTLALAMTILSALRKK